MADSLSSDLYGFAERSLDDATRLVAAALGVAFEVRHSLYLGGDYDLHREGKETLRIQSNIDPIDDEPAELDWPDHRALLYVEGTARAEDIRGALAALDDPPVHLRQED